MAYSFSLPQQQPADVHTLLAANRLEARPRSPEFNRALRAEIRDPAWLLARQWQMHEFRAEDRGAPAAIELSLREQPLAQLAVGTQPARAYDAQHQPLEAAVEAQPRVLGLGLRLQMGQYWRRQLRATLLAALPAPVAPADVQAALAAFGGFGLAPQPATQPVAFAQEATTPEALALLALAGPAALDGYALYLALTTAPGVAAQLAPALADSDQLAERLGSVALLPGLAAAIGQASGYAVLQQLPAGRLEAELRRFVLTFHRLYLLGHDSAGWATEDLAYSFKMGAAGGTGLGASHYPGGAALPWYSVDELPAAPAGTPAAPAATTRRLLPARVQLPGAPATRWWEFEDRRVDLGQVAGDAADWGRLLLQEFMFLFQNDWFSVPCAVPGGTVCRLDEVLVTDVFGRTYALQPAGAGQLKEASGALIDNDAGRWRLFAQAGASRPDPKAAPQLYLPPAVPSPLVSRPVEQVSFRREEATNLVWAVESIVPDGFAGGLDGTTAAARVAETLRTLVPATPSPAPANAAAAAPAYTYQLDSGVPENWIPFVPATAAAPGLEQGVMHRQGLSLSSIEAEVLPRTSLLQLRPGQPYLLHEHEVPPAGVRVDGLSYRARWHGGRTISWFGRQRGPAQLGGSSGLAFDLLTPGGA